MRVRAGWERGWCRRLCLFCSSLRQRLVDDTMSEKSSPSPSGATPWFRVVAVTLGVAVVAVLTVNVGMTAALVRQQRSDARERNFWVLCQPGFSLRERETAFRSLVAVGNREWRAADVGGLNLAGWALPGADLQFAQFLRANLAGADLTGAKLNGGSLELADLTNAGFSDAEMVEMRLLQAVLRGAVLRGAKLRACRMAQIEAENADFSVADLADADLVMANLTGARLIGTNFAGAKLASAVFKGANLSLARFEGADLTDADFTDANWWTARGLTTKQLAMLKAKFPPTAAAPQALREDFARWAEVPLPSQ